MTNVRKLTGVDILAEATASGDAAAIAAATAMPTFQYDRVIVDGTLGCWDFKSISSNPGGSITTSTTFTNLVRGGSPITVSNATGLTQKTVSGDIVGINLADSAAKLILPAACNPVAGQGRFGMVVWATIDARTVTNYSSLVGYGYATTTQASIQIDLPTTSGGANVVPNIDGGSATASAYTLGTRFQVACEYVPNGASSEKRVWWNGSQLAVVSFNNGGSLNIPTQAGFTDFMIGQLGSHNNTGMDWTLHRLIVEDFAISGRTMADLVAIDWDAYQNRF